MRVLIVDDHALSRLGLVMFLGANAADVTVTALSTIEDGVAHARTFRDIVLILIDYSLWKQNEAKEGSLSLGSLFPGIPVLITRGAPDPAEAERAFKSGARGYLRRDVLPSQLRDSLIEFLSPAVTRDRPAALRPGTTPIAPDDSNLAAALAQAADGSFGLTARETEVIRLLLNGSSNKEIGRTLGILEGTVKVHVHNIMRKLGARNRMQLVLWAQGKSC